MFGLLKKLSGQSASATETIDVAEARERSKQGMTFIDVRTPAEWSQTGLPSRALAISLLDGSFISKVEDAVNADKTAPILVICRTGARSAQACKVLRKAGFTHPINVKGGILAWQLANLPKKPLRG
ncbi:rhodanese-like domain-containing protein [Hirschia litorea]|uniref:Rhodanese-like domain-containing protein n=1 Tax=Hirschia litorea TaxID=1199156 RepID=A0ABW2IJP8_9PROT